MTRTGASRSRVVMVGALLGLLGLVTGQALAQEEGGRRGGRGGGGPGGGFGGGFGGGMTIDKATLLGSAQVRTELKIKEDKAKKLDEALAAHRQALVEIRGGGRNRDASPEEREKQRKEMEEKGTALRKKLDTTLADLIDKDQMKRLGEIELQAQGADGLVSEPVVAALKLSKEQVEKLKGVLSARDEARRGLFGGGGGGDFQGMREKMDKLRKEADEKAASVLSKEQTEELAKLKGAAFELDRSQLFPGRGGRGGPGGPGGGGRGGPGGGAGGGERQRPPQE